MKKHLQKDFKRRICAQRFERRRLVLKTNQNHSFFSAQKRFLALTQLSKLDKNSSKVKVRNRCVSTGRARGVYNFFRIARTMIRDLASKGLLPGVRKAS
jgi:small subunit ribosomal protein S14